MDIVVFGIIDVHFDLRDDLCQFFHKRCQQSFDGSAQGPDGAFGVDFISCLNQIVHTFGLRKIDLAVEKGATGKFSPQSRPRSRPEQQG